MSPWDTLRRWMRRIREILERIARWIRRILEEMRTGYGDYDRSKWRWDPRRRRWILEDSEQGGTPKGYNCTEYCIARIQGRPPRWGGDPALTTETDEIERKLADLGWTTGECDCGLATGQSPDCVAVYVCDGQVVHAAILDKVHGDWGGKLSAGGPIARFRRPEDYFEEGRVPDGCAIRFWCPPRPLGGTQLPDDQLHRDATPL